MVTAMNESKLFVGCDWGSTSFRVRLVEFGSRRIVSEQATTDGIRMFAVRPASERSTAMAAFLAERLAAWPDLPLTTPIVISGMASSNVGWRELPYATTPLALDGSQCRTDLVEIPTAAGHTRTALLVSGVRTDDDIIRGEECALIGVNALRRAARPSGVSTLALLAGTHPKHALLRDGALVSFRTHLTGELFDALTGAGLLSASIDRVAAGGEPDLAAYREGVACVRERGVSGSLFQVRARHVLRGSAKSANTWFLSGVLIGAELEQLTRQFEKTDLLLVGEPLRIRLYRAAMLEVGLVSSPDEPPAIDLNAAMIAGQEALLLHRRRSAPS